MAEIIDITENIPEENIYLLEDNDGNEVPFEFVDLMEYEGEEYLILMPAEEEETHIVILEIEPVDEENENYLSIDDEDLLNTVYGLFKEKYKDILTFED